MSRFDRIFERSLVASLLLTAAVVVIVVVAATQISGDGIGLGTVIAAVAGIVVACSLTAWQFQRRSAATRQ